MKPQRARRALPMAIQWDPAAVKWWRGRADFYLSRACQTAICLQYHFWLGLVLQHRVHGNKQRYFTVACIFVVQPGNA